MNRRNILATLGLGSVAGLINTEALADTEITSDGCPGLVRCSVEHQNRIADSLENLAKEIRAGRVNAVTLKATSVMERDTWLSHDVTVKVEIINDQQES